MSKSRSARSPAVYTIPAGLSFLDSLVAGLRGGSPLVPATDDPLGLSRLLILVPTRRAARALIEAFARQSPHGAMLLPRISPLGDLDDDEDGLGDGALADAEALPPVVPPIERQLLLTRLILAADRARGASAPEQAPMAADHAARLAIALAHFLDEAQTEQVELDLLAALAPERYAAHWQEVLRFLAVLTEHWPKLQKEMGVLDPAARRNAALERIAARWRKAPPAHPVIAAGTTGSIPATADLLAVIARLPKGAVVLPGLDLGLDEESWTAVDASHPQFGLKRLLERLQVPRSVVQAWPAGRALAPAAKARQALLREAMRPAETTMAWQTMAPIEPGALEGLHHVECAQADEEAAVIALRLREALVTPGRTAALVTLDRPLARRVSAQLGRWGITIDDSAGEPLSATPPGVLLRLCAELGSAQVAPVPLLALLKHPLAAGNLEPAQFRRLARRLERRALRGPRPQPGFAGLRQTLEAAVPSEASRLADPELRAWLNSIEQAFAPFAALLAQKSASLGALLGAHVSFAEWLASTTDQPGSGRLYAFDAGEVLAGFLAALSEAKETLPDLHPADYPALFEALIAGPVVRPRRPGHPRLHLWGPLEARLQHADVMVLGGLNETGWPPASPGDPWLSRPMRAEFGLSPLERRIGLSAHDFAQLATAPTVLLTRAQRSEGAPSVPSRWLSRLGAVLHRQGGLAAIAQPRYRDYAAALDRPAEYRPTLPPAPTPPLRARPRQLRLTRLETLITDPYAIYADKVLCLKPLAALDQDAGAAERGSVIHEALDRFFRMNVDLFAPTALDRLLEAGRAAFAPYTHQPGVMALWWPRFLRIAAWFIETERDRRASASPLATEAQGTLSIALPGGPFTIDARADRIDRLKSGGLAIIDYKTGQAPSGKQVAAGIAPQLPLEALMATAGTFKGVDAAPVEELSYWRLSGREPAGKITRIKEDPTVLATRVYAMISALLRKFDDPKTPYRATPRPGLLKNRKYRNDYEHLARNAEWSVSGSAEDD